jgi:hypothetical protein
VTGSKRPKPLRSDSFDDAARKGLARLTALKGRETSREVPSGERMAGSDRGVRRKPAFREHDGKSLGNERTRPMLRKL